LPYAIDLPLSGVAQQALKPTSLHQLPSVLTDGTIYVFLCCKTYHFICIYQNSLLPLPFQNKFNNQKQKTQ
jgi:hypothetical protein